MKAYKVVCNRDGKLGSTNYYTKVTYKVGKWVKPKLKSTRLFVFDTLENAMSALIMLNGHNHEIYECECRGVIPGRRLQENPKWINNVTKRYLSYWQLFNKLIRQHKKAALPINIINGTMFAKEVKLLKKVH